jgi:probable phosphoglycerate mutase
VPPARPARAPAPAPALAPWTAWAGLGLVLLSITGGGVSVRRARGPPPGAGGGGLAWFGGVTRSYPSGAFAVPADATELVIVRHGASAPVIPGEAPFDLVDGHSDPPLAPEGEAQARAVGERLAAYPAGRDLRHDAAAHRPDRRAARGGGRPAPVVVPELREVGLGEWEGGEIRVRAANRDPVLAQVYAEQRWDVIPGAEPAEAFAERVRAGVERIVAAAGPGVSVAAFLHGGVIGEICREATGARRLAFVHADNGSITRLVVLADGRRILRSFNDTAHLA